MRRNPLHAALAPTMLAAAILAPVVPGATGEDAVLATGKHTPALTLRAADGATYDLADQRGKQPVVLVFYRGLW